MWETLRFMYLVAKLANLRKRQPIQVLRLQKRRFRQMLRFAAEHSPFYRRRFGGINVDRCQPSDLPVTTKAETMASFDEVMTDRAVKRSGVERWVSDLSNLGKYYLDRYVVCHTSGSQGQPILIVQEPKDMMLTFALQIARANPMPKNWRTFLSRLGNRSRWAAFSLRPGFYPSGAAWAYMPAPARRFANHLRLNLLDPLEQNVAKLNEFKPNFLTAYASVLEMLAREEQAGRLRLRQAGTLKLVTNMSEPLHSSARDVIEQTFGVHVSDHYAMGECMALSVGCPFYSGAHLNADLAYLEVVDEQNRPVPAGVRGAKVLVTNLYNRIMPFIRYEIGDVVTMNPDRCRCGSNLPHIPAVEGRTKERFFIQSNGAVRELEWHLLIHPLTPCLDIGEYQYTQTAPNRFLLRAAAVAGRTLDPERLRSLVMDTLHAEGIASELTLDVEIVTSIGPDPRSGKMKRMVALKP